MAEKIAVVLGQKDHRDFNLSEIRAVTIQPQTEEIIVKSTEQVQVITPTEGKFFDKVTVDSVALDKPDQTKTTIPTKERQVVKADVGFELAENIVEPIPSEYITTTDADAISSDILEGKSAYVNGEKIVGDYVPLDISDTTATAEDVAQGKVFYNNLGQRTEGLGAISTGEDRLQARVDETKSCAYLFYKYEGTNQDIAKGLNTIGVTNMKYMFSNCAYLVNLDISSLDTSKVTDMSEMFSYCTKILNLDLSHFNTKEVENMSYMFGGLSSIQSLNLSNFNVENVTTMSNMFNSCKKLTSLDLSNFKTPKLKSMDSMFKWCENLQSLNLSNFNTENVTSMQTMFQYNRQLTSLDLSSFNTSKVTNMGDMFFDCGLLTDIYGVLDLISVTSLSRMFDSCDALTTMTLKNIKKTGLTIGSGTSYGTLLTLDTLINTVKELWDYSSGTTTYTLTMSTPSKTALAEVYVKLITPTAEQIEADPNIVNKMPCEVCESTDEGAMLITDYATLKKWTIK